MQLAGGQDEIVPFDVRPTAESPDLGHQCSEAISLLQAQVADVADATVAPCEETCDCQSHGGVGCVVHVDVHGLELFGTD